MIKTNRGRYDEAVKYLKRLDVPLSESVKEWTRGRESSAGGKLALGGKKWDADEEKRAATRAHLLCVVAFFGHPHAADATALDYYCTTIRDACRNKSKGQVKDEIDCYRTLPTATLEHLAHAAETVKNVDTINFPSMRLRSDVNVGKGPICYDGVFNWLYAAGFISRRWLGKRAGGVHASTIHQYLGDGPPIPVKEWGSIARGKIWNIHKTTDRTTCHWGVSLGGGLAAGCNNTGQGQVDYKDGGDDAYGQFIFTELCAVLETTEKYAGANRLVVKTAQDDEPTKKTTSTSKMPLGSYITVRVYSPLSGAAERIYF